MPFIDEKSLEYPLTEQDVRRRFPSVLLPAAFVAPDGFAPVFASPAPAYNPDLQFAREVAPARRNSDGKWFQVWEIVDLPPRDEPDTDQAI